MARRSAVERKIGSSRVLWEQMKRTPDCLDFWTEGGGVPLTITRTPSALKA